MRSRGIVGKKIARIEQRLEACSNHGMRDPCYVVHAIILEDGTRLEPETIETDFGHYFHTFHVVRPRRSPTSPSASANKNWKARETDA